MISDILEKVDEIRQILIAEIESSDETVENKKGLIALFSGMSPMELLQLRFPGYQQPIDGTPANQAILNFVPPFAMYSPMNIEKGSSIGIALLNEATVQVSWETRPDFYFIIYFIKISSNSFKACCCFSDLFNYLYGRDICGYKVLPKLSKSIEKQFPSLCKKIGAVAFGGKNATPYLNTVAFNNKAKQWFLMVNINDIDEWENLRLYGPASPLFNDVMNLMYQATVHIFGDIYKSGDALFVDKVEKFLGFSFNLSK